MVAVKSVGELSGMSFFIPKYQRGYRWTRQEVSDLLSDLAQFLKYGHAAGVYCLHPLVVSAHLTKDQLLARVRDTKSVEENRRLMGDSWDVIDGQQRLTTLHILLSYLGGVPSAYGLTYETRNGSEGHIGTDGFLRRVSELAESETAEQNIDFHHMAGCFKAIRDWFASQHPEIDRKAFRELVLNRVKFIWCEPEEKDPVAVFKRLNIGRIPLTNADLG